MTSSSGEPDAAVCDPRVGQGACGAAQFDRWQSPLPTWGWGGEDGMSYSTLLFDMRDGVATVTLNRPEAANSLNIDLARDLMQAMLRCDEDPAIRAVVLTGAGRM